MHTIGENKRVFLYQNYECYILYLSALYLFNLHIEKNNTGLILLFYIKTFGVLTEYFLKALNIGIIYRSPRNVPSVELH